MKRIMTLLIVVFCGCTATKKTNINVSYLEKNTISCKLSTPIYFLLDKAILEYNQSHPIFTKLRYIGICSDDNNNFIVDCSDRFNCVFFDVFQDNLVCFYYRGCLVEISSKDIEKFILNELSNKEDTRMKVRCITKKVHVQRCLFDNNYKFTNSFKCNYY